MWHRLQLRNSWNTIYTGNVVCFWCIIVNTVHEGDNRDDDDDDDNNNNNNNNNNGTFLLIDVAIPSSKLKG